MSFTVKTEILNSGTKLTLAGALDSSSAPALHEEIKKLVSQNPKELIMDMEQLDFMASAGLRVIIFAKQKLGPAVNLIMVKPTEQVVETLRMTGLIFSVVILDKYPE